MTQLFRKQLAIAIFPVLLLAAISTLGTTYLSEQHMLAQLRQSLAIESQLQLLPSPSAATGRRRWST
jgi:hypothetical protein